MPLKCWKTDDLQISINLRTVIHKFLHLSIQCRLFITAQPFGIHIRKQTAERTACQLLQ